MVRQLRTYSGMRSPFARVLQSDGIAAGSSPQFAPLPVVAGRTTDPAAYPYRLSPRQSGRNEPSYPSVSPPAAMRAVMNR
jgi:hypothetical protein